MRATSSEFRPGDRVSGPDGYFPSGASRPNITGTVVDLCGPYQWPIVDWDHKPSANCFACVPSSITLLDPLDLGYLDAISDGSAC